MQQLRAFWARSLLNKLVLVSVVGVLCCCPVVAINSRGGSNSTAAVAPAGQATEAPAATEEPTAEPTEEPTEAPAPTAEPAAADPAVAAYASTVGQAVQQIGEAMGGIGEAMRNPQLTDQAWVLELAANTVLVEDAHATLVAVEDVPESAAELHPAILSATADCDAGVKLLRQALDARNAAQLEESGTLIASCTSKINGARPLLEQFIAANA